MGTLVHQALVVSSWHKKAVEEAHQYAKSLFGSLVSPICASELGIDSFCVFPCGSKLGWEVQTIHNKRLTEFASVLPNIHRCDDDSFPLDFVWADFGSDMYGCDLVAGSKIVCDQSTPPEFEEEGE